MGEQIPMGADGGGHLEFGSQPDAIPETNTAPESSRQPPSDGGGMPIPSATSVQPEVSDALLEALKSGSILDEHRALMGAVIEKIQSAESGVNGACISLIKGFEVCFSKSVMVWIVAPDTLFGERKNRTEDRIYDRRKTH